MPCTDNIIRNAHGVSNGIGEFGIVFKAHLVDWFDDQRQLTVAVKALKGIATNCIRCTATIIINLHEFLCTHCQVKISMVSKQNKRCLHCQIECEMPNLERTF